MIDMIERLSKSGAIAIYMNMRCGNEKNIYSTFFNNLEAAISNVYVEMKRNDDRDPIIAQYGTELINWLGDLYGVLPMPAEDEELLENIVDKRLSMAIASTNMILKDCKV